MSRRLFWRFAYSRLGRAVHLLVARNGNHSHCPICRFAWRSLESDAGFREGMRRAEADFAAGRTVRYRVEDL